MTHTDVTALLALYQTETQQHVPLDSNKIDQFIAAKHNRQYRKDGTPYVGHLRNVRGLASVIAEQAGQDDYGRAVCAAAGALHDSSEDQDVDFEDLVAVANTEVALLVAFVSDDKRLPSAIRHQHYLHRLAVAPLRAQVVKLADLFDNSRDAVLAVDLDYVTRRIQETQGALVPSQALAGQQLERNKPIMLRWADKARAMLAVLTQLRDVPAYATILANLGLITSKAGG